MEAARGLIQSWEQFIQDNKDEITALQILYNHGQSLRFEQLKELAETIESPPHFWTTDTLWAAYERLGKTTDRTTASMTGAKHLITDLVSLVRLALHEFSQLVPYTDDIRQRYQNWLDQQADLGRTFTPEQRQWLDLICEHITTSLAMDLEDFEYTPFTQYGGLGRAHQVFGPDIVKLLEELNRTLAA